MKTGTQLKSSPFKFKMSAHVALKTRINRFTSSVSLQKKKSLKKLPTHVTNYIVINDKKMMVPYSGVMDSEFSRWIRNRDKRCLKCGSTEDLTNSHFHGRDHSGTRYHQKNCDTLCKWCHSIWEYEKKPGQEYYEWKLRQLGEVKFKELEQLANTKVLRYDAIVECMKFLADNPINNLKEINI